MKKIKVCVGCLFFLHLLLWSSVFPSLGQDYYPQGSPAGAGPQFYELSDQFFRTFEVYLARADMRDTGEAWLETARFGIETVTAEWERKALLMTGAGASDRLEAVLEERMEERFFDWLARDFFGREKAEEAAGLFEEVRYANRLHLFDTDPEGGIRTDAAGDPILKKSSGFESDLEGWRGMVAEKEAELLRAWEENVRVDASEILVYMNEASGPEDPFSERFSRYKAGLTRELTAIFAAEEQRFTAKRLRDQYSLRKKTEGSSASEIAAGLIGAAEEELEAGLETVRSGLAAENWEGTEGREIIIDPDQWRETFRAEFDKGLERWDRAEEALLEARVRWEQDINAGFRRTEEAWADAYRELTDARKKWEREISSVLAEGRAEWDEKQAGLAAAIDDARGELVRSMEERAGYVESRVKNLVEIILQSRQTMRTAKDSRDYWEERAGKKGTEDGTAGRELEYWKAVYDEYADYAEAAEADLAGVFGFAFFDREDGPSAPGLPETGLAGSYREVLEGGAWEHLFLDDYQAELLKARSLEKYWEKELEISRAVYDYAMDETSGRKTEAETRRDYEEAFRLYKEKKEAYSDAAAELEKKGAALSEGREELSRLRQLLTEAGEELEEARSAYTLAMDLFATGNDDYFREKVAEYEKRLRELRGNGEAESGASPAEEADGPGNDGDEAAGPAENLPAALEAFYEAARRYDFEHRLFVRMNETDLLTNGDPENEMFASFEELEKRRDAAELWTFPEDSADLERKLETCLGLDPGSGLWIKLKEEYEAYRTSDAAGETGEAWYRKTVFEKLVEGVRLNIEADYEERKETLAFIEGGEDIEFSELYAGVESEAEQAAEDFFREKARVESDAWDLVLESLEEEEESAGPLLPDPGKLGLLKAAADAGDVPSALAYSYFLFRGPPDSDAVNISPDLESVILDYYQGKGTFMIEGTDLTALFLTDAAAERRARERRLEMMTRYRNVSPDAVSSLRREARAELAAAVEEGGPAAWEEIEGAVVSFAAQAAAAPLSAAGGYGIERYIKGLYGYVSLRRAAERSADDGAASVMEEAASLLKSAEAETVAVKEWFARVRDCYGGITGADSAGTSLESVRRLCAAGKGEGQFLSSFGREYGPVLAEVTGLIEIYTAFPSDGPVSEEELRAEASEALNLRRIFSAGYGAVWEEEDFLSTLKSGGEVLLGATSEERKILLAAALELAGRVLKAEAAAGAAALEEKRRSEGYRKEFLASAELIERYGIEGGWYEGELEDRMRVWDDASKRIVEWAGAGDAAGSDSGTVTIERLEQLHTVRGDARKRIEEIEGEINGLKGLRADTRAALELFEKESEDRYAGIVRPLELEAADAEDRYLQLRETWENAAEEFSRRNREYAEAYERVKNAESDKDEAKQVFRKSDALLEYASREYLYPAAAEERWNETQNMYDKVKGAYDALHSLYASAEPKVFSDYEENALYRNAYETYRTHFQNALALKQMHGLVNQAIAVQEQKVADGENTLLERAVEIVVPAAEMDRGKMLDFYLETAAESWLKDASDLLESKGDEMLRVWGLAFWHLKWKDAKSGSDSFQSHLNELIGNPKQFFDEEGIDYVSFLRNASSRAFASLSGRERELLTRYYEWMYPGKTGALRAKNKLFLEERMKAEINRRLGAVCEQKEKEKRKAAETAYITAGGFYALGTAFSWFPPVSIPAFASFGVFMGVGLDFEHTAGKFEEAGKETERTRQTVMTERLEPAVKDFSRALKEYHRAFGALEKERKTLALLTGPASGGERLTAAAFAEAVIEAGALRGKDVGAFLGHAGAGQKKVKSAIVDMISLPGYLDSLEEEERYSSPEMLSALAEQAERVKIRAEADFESAAAAGRDKQREAVDAYRSALKEGPFTEQLDEAFGEPSFRGNEHLAGIYRLFDHLQNGVDSVSFPFAAALEKELFEEQAGTLVKIYTERMARTAAVYEQKWKVRMEDLALREKRWEESMRFILAEGSSRWGDSIARLDRTRRKWLDAYDREYTEQTEMWNLKYLTLLENRNGWVDKAGKKAAFAGSEAVLRELGESAGTGIRQARSIVVPEFEYPAVSPEKAADEILRGASFSNLIAGARSSNRSITAFDTGVYARTVLPRLAGYPGFGGPAAGNVLPFRAGYREKIEEHIALITAGRAREAAESAIRRFRRRVAEANVEVDEDIRLMLTGKNFKSAGGGRYTRTVLVDDTVLGGKEHETQSIKGYEDYILPDIVLGVDLSESTLAALSPAGVEAQIDLAFEELDKIRKRVFGGRKDGEFGEHVGDMAALSAKPDPKASIEKNLSERGSGELGRISRAFFGFLLKESRGWGEFNKPLSEKRLWDDDGRLFEAPTIRKIADIGTAVLVNAVAPGAGFALNLIDDAVFSLADVAKGRYSAGEALLQLGKKGITAGATAGIGAGAGALGDVLGGGFLGKTAAAGVKSFGGTAAAGAVNAVELDADGGRLRFNGKSFLDTVAGKEALAGYSGGIASAAVSGILTGNLEGLEGTDLEGGIRSVSGLTGAAVDAGIEYGMTGETTLNLLNAGGVGLLEFSLGGESDKPFAFGTGGTDVSAVRLIKAARGMSAWMKQQRIRLFEGVGEIDFGGEYAGYRRAGTLLRSAWAYGDEAAGRAVEAVLSGAAKLHIGFGTGNGRGKTAAGEGGRKDIYLASLGADDDQASRLRAGIVLQHEAWRDGVISNGDMQRIETVAAAAAHTKMALSMANRYGPGTILGDENLTEDVNAYLRGGMQFVNYVNASYDSTQDFWKLLTNGNLQYDGTGFLHDGSGNLIRGEDGKPIGARGIEGGLLKILGLEDTPANRQSVISMMLEAEMDHTVGADPEDTTAWMWNLGSNSDRTVEVGKEEFLENYLHHLDARDHYRVLGQKDFLDKELIGIFGTSSVYRNISFEEWSFGNARNTYRQELSAMKNDLMKNNGWTKAEAEMFMADVTKSFAVLDTASGPEEFLGGFRTGLRSLREGGISDKRHHTLVHLTDRVFRGLGGDMGLAEALRAEYRAAGYDEEYAAGLSIQAAAETYTGEYLHMIYGREKEKDREPKSQYRHNYAWGGGNFDYSVRATGFFDPENGYRWTGSRSENPAVDCVGFANLAYHSAGLIGYNERINSGGGSVDSIYYNEDVTPTGFPIPGDLIFMEGHVGIYGIDESGSPMIIHSAPAVDVLSREEGEKMKHVYNSGPRINMIGDEYWKEYMEDLSLMESWENMHGFNYGRWTY